MGESTQEKIYEVVLPLEKYEALINEKYEAREEAFKSEANADEYRNKYWIERNAKDELTKTLGEMNGELAKAKAEIEVYKAYFANNPTANTEYKMWLTEYQGDDEA